MTPIHRFWPSVLLWLAGCSTQPPSPLDIDHPAHPGAQVSPTLDDSADTGLSRYRDYSPPLRGTGSALSVTDAPPVDGASHDHHQ